MWSGSMSRWRPEVHFVVQQDVPVCAHDDGVQIRIQEPPEMNEVQSVEGGKSKGTDKHARAIVCQCVFRIVERCRFDHDVSRAMKCIAQSPQTGGACVDQQNGWMLLICRVHDCQRTEPARSTSAPAGKT